MSNGKPLKKIPKSGFRRRLSVTLAGAESGMRLLGVHASSVFKNTEQKSQVRSQALRKEARAFAKKLGELKGAYVKIGQMMALYGEHILPPEVTRELRQLESHTQPLGWTVIRAELEQQLGDTLGELEVEQQPIAAASLAQVHRARRKQDGVDLCLKVQYPGVAQTIEDDFELVLQMLRLTRWAKNSIAFEHWLIDMKRLLLDEVDYHREAEMMVYIQTQVAGDPRYQVPEVYARYSRNTVLAMSTMFGVSVTSKKLARLSLKRRNALAYAMLENFFNEVFDWGVMQTDPNFGNYQILCRNRPQGMDKIVLLDFGAVRELPKDFRRALQHTILAAHQQNKAQVIEGAIALGCLHAEQSDAAKQSFAEFCLLLMEPFRRDHQQTPNSALSLRGVYNWHQSNLLRRVAKQGARAVMLEGFRSPPKEFALIARKLTGVFTFITTLKAEFDAYPIIEKYCE